MRQNMSQISRARAPWTIFFQGLVFLGLLCALFYATLNYYAGNALLEIGQVQGIPGAGENLGLAALRRLFFLRVGCSLVFCLMLGVFGFRITGTLWAGALVHGVAVVFMLWQDVPLGILRDNALLVLCLIGVVALLTFLASLSARWSSRKPRRRR